MGYIVSWDERLSTVLLFSELSCVL